MPINSEMRVSNQAQLDGDSIGSQEMGGVRESRLNTGNIDTQYS